MSNTRKYSSVVIDGYERAASRAMLYPVGFKKEDFKNLKVDNIRELKSILLKSTILDKGNKNYLSSKFKSFVGYKKNVLKSHKLELHQPGQWLRHAICISMI